MNRFSKVFLVGAAAVLALSDTAALADEQAASESASPAAAASPETPDNAAEAEKQAATDGQSETAAAQDEAAETASAAPGAEDNAGAEEKTSDGAAHDGSQGEGSDIESQFNAASEDKNGESADDPDAARQKALLGEEIDQNIDRVTDQAVTEAMEGAGESDDPDAQRAVDQAITEAVDEAMADAAVRSEMGPAYHTPSTVGNDVEHLRNLRPTASVSGGTGLLRTESAIFNPSGVVRLSLMGEFASQNSFPVNGTDVTHTAARFAANLAFLRYFEGFFSYRIASDYGETNGETALSQTLGDFRFGAKGATQIVDGFYLGGALKFALFPGFGADWDGGVGFEFTPELIASWDVRTLNRSVPLVVHFNLGASFTNLDKIYGDYDPTAFEEFAQDINRYSRLAIALGFEIPLPYVTPYAEWDMALPITSATLHDFDGKSVSTGSAMSNRFAVGGKVTALPDVTFSMGLEFGLNGKTARGVAATPAFMIHLGLSYAFDPLMHHRKDSGAVVDLPPAALADKPETSEAPADTEGGEPQTPPAAAVTPTDSEVPEAGSAQEQQEDKADKSPMLQITVNGAPVRGRLIVLEDDAKSFDVDSAGTPIPLEAGQWMVAVAADGYFAQVKELNVPEAAEGESAGEPQKMEISIEARQLPEKPTVSIEGSELKLDGKIAFVGKSSKMQSSADGYLDQIADLLLRGKVSKLSIEGHTDFPKGSNAESLLELSQARADAVKNALMERGVLEARLVARGFGGTKPLKPNGLPKGREMNRRIEFKVIP